MDNAPCIIEYKTNDTVINKTRQFNLDNGKLYFSDDDDDDDDDDDYDNNNNNNDKDNNNKGILCEL